MVKVFSILEKKELFAERGTVVSIPGKDSCGKIRHCVVESVTNGVAKDGNRVGNGVGRINNL